MTTPHKKPPPLGIRAAAVLVSAVWDALNVMRYVLACNDRGKTLTFKQQWPERAFTIRDGVADPRIIIIKGRNRWALENLMWAGSKGCTPIHNPAPRWSAYVFSLRESGVEIETLHEPHGGPFPGNHARYVLRSCVTTDRGDIA